MQKLKIFVSKNKASLWFSAALNAMILGCFLLLYIPCYEASDDAMMQNIASGFLGKPDAHLVYINYLIGLLLKALYGFSASIPWYALLQYVVMFCSFTAITYIFLNRKCTPITISLLAVFLCFFGFEGYVLLQFTKVASISACAGTALLFWGSLSEKRRIGALVAGGGLLTISTMYRFEQAIVVCGIVCTIGLCFLLHKKKMDSKVFMQKLILCVCAFAVPLTMIGGAYLFDQSAYASEEWRDYKVFNKARSVILDNGVPDFETIEPALAEMGIDETAYEMLLAWTYEDFDKFTPETMVAMAELRNVKPINVSTILDFIVKTVSGVFQTLTFYCFMILLAAWLLFGKQEKPQIISVLFCVFMLIVLFAYFHFVLSRVFVNRVDSGIWMAASLTLLFFIDPSKEISSRHGSLVLTCLIAFSVLFSGPNAYYTHLSSDAKTVEKTGLQVFDAIAQDKEHLYFTTVLYNENLPLGTQHFCLPFSTTSSGFGENIYYLGGWTARMPITLQQLEPYYVTNPIKDMINNEKVYFIGEDYELLLAYIQTWYDKTAEFVYVKSIGTYNVYSVQTSS